jgi:hypothetical protein
MRPMGTFSKKKVTSLVLTLTLGTAGLAAGCKKNSAAAATAPAAKQDEAKPDAPKPEAAPAPDPDAVLSEKMGSYINCVNQVDPIVGDSREAYHRFLVKDDQVNPKQPPIVRPMTGRFDDCYKAIEEAAKVEPKVADLEESAAGYAGALKALAPIMAEADTYYRQEDWKDDGFAKGKELNGKIVAAFDAFAKARGQLHRTIDKYNDQILARALARIEKREGKSLRYYSRRIMNDASALLDLGLDPAADPAALRDAIEAYKNIFAEMVAKAEKEPAVASAVKNWPGFLNRGNNFLHDAKEIQRAIVAQLDKAPGKPVKLADMLRHDLIESYNHMVEESNGLEFPAPADAQAAN